MKEISRHCFLVRIMTHTTFFACGLGKWFSMLHNWILFWWGYVSSKSRGWVRVFWIPLFCCYYFDEPKQKVGLYKWIACSSIIFSISLWLLIETGLVLVFWTWIACMVLLVMFKIRPSLAASCILLLTWHAEIFWSTFSHYVLHLVLHTFIGKELTFVNLCFWLKVYSDCLH